MSTPVTKITSKDYDKKSRHLLEVEAEAALELQKKIKADTDLLDQKKEFFREAADGETFEHTVPGLGSLMVKKPAKGGTVISTVFDQAAYEALPADKQAELIKAGVVSIVRTIKADSKAAVTLKLNV